MLIPNHQTNYSLNIIKKKKNPSYLSTAPFEIIASTTTLNA